MDDATKHDSDTQEDIKDESQDVNRSDEGVDTPADTDKGEPKKQTAEDVKEKQKESWLKKLSEGKKTLDEMPDNLGWLKKEPEFDKFKKQDKKQPEGDVRSEIRNALKEERAEEEYSFMIQSLQDSDVSAEQEATMKEEYESYLENFSNPTAVQKVKALNVARRLAGIKNISEYTKERRRKGMTLPPLTGTKKRDVGQKKDKLTEMEKKFNKDLPW